MARGSIQRRGDTWTAIVDLPADPATGKRRQKRVTRATRKEVQLEVARLLTASEAGFIDAGKVTLREFMDHWLDTSAPTVKSSTLRRYRDLNRLHLLPLLGGVRLAKLSPADVQRLYSDRLAAGLSPTSVRHLHGVLHHALDDAVRWGLVGRNVTDAVDPPKRSTPEMQTWSTEQMSQVLLAAQGDDLEALWRLALLCGLRRGEVIGLRWSDVDLTTGALSIRRTLSRGLTSRLEAGEPKTAAGKRRITMPPSVVDGLKRHRIQQLEQRLALADAYNDQDLIFANPFGGPIHPNTIGRGLRRLAARAGVPAIPFHDLRHTCATMLLAEGVHPKIVQERLGHSDIAMTLNLYSHVSEDMQRDASDRLDAAIAAAAERVS